MFRWLIKRKKRITDIDRYIILIFCMITDIKKIEYLERIYDFTETMWKKEKREEFESETASE